MYGARGLFRDLRALQGCGELRENPHSAAAEEEPTDQTQQNGQELPAEGDQVLHGEDERSGPGLGHEDRQRQGKPDQPAPNCREDGDPNEYEPDQKAVLDRRWLLGGDSSTSFQGMRRFLQSYAHWQY